MRFILTTLLCVFLAGCSHTSNRPTTGTKLTETNPLSNVKRTTLYKERVDRMAQKLITQKHVNGAVVGLITKDGIELYHYGDGSKPPTKNTAITENTLFEIGSVTKTFTAILLAKMVRQKMVRLDQPVQSLLPAGVTLASLNGKAITLSHLATHVSGLPRMPTNFRPKNMNNPYVDYSKEKLYQFINTWKPTRAPGARYEYSNVGLGLLGHVLALKAGKPYEELLKAWVLKPLGLRHTSISLTGLVALKRAHGHDGDRNPVPNWEWKVLAPCGGLWSTLGDLVHYVRLNLGLSPSSLAPSLTLTQQKQRPRRSGHMGLAWHIDTPGSHLHTGGTGGFASFVGFNRAKTLGVVILANGGTAYSGATARFGKTLMKMLMGIPAVLHLPKDHPVPRTTLETYVGRYQLDPKTIFVVRLKGDHLTMTSAGKSARLYARSHTLFYLRVAPFLFRFFKDDKDGTIRLVMAMGKTKIPLKRIK